VRFFEELRGYPKIRAVFGRTVRLFKNPSSFSKNRAVVGKSVQFFEGLRGCWKFCPVFRTTLQLFEILSSFSNNWAVVRDSVRLFEQLWQLFEIPSSFSKNCTDIRKSVRLFEYLSSSPKIRPVLQRSLKIAPFAVLLLPQIQRINRLRRSG
jgi:hypothetical protein